MYNVDNPLDKLESDQRFALLDFKAKHGTGWRSKLLLGWERASFPGVLQRIRNELGPEWLATVKKGHFDAPWTPPLKQINVWVEGLEDDVSIPAYTTDAQWNGFACHLLTLEGMRHLAGRLPDVVKEVGDGTFHIINEAYDEPEIVKPEMREVEGNALALYVIDGWCWHNADAEEAADVSRPSAPRARM